jgi:cytidylate kinase
MDPPVYSGEIFRVVSGILENTYRTTGGLILGQGGSVALKAHKDVLRVFLHAPRHWRIQHLVDRGLANDPERAYQMIQASDKGRGAFIQEISGMDWCRACNYDLCLDASSLGLEACATLICSLFPR